ncbi:MAG: ABC transporter substrate-binding protein [Candidatus Polarisedimenticolia bacterium]
MIDGLGRRVGVPTSPRRLVALAPSVTDLLFALGLGDRVVGISDFCKPPPGAPPIPRVGGLVNPSLEAIRALDPDLLIATSSGNDPGLGSQATALGVPLYTVHTPNVAAVLAAALALADALGEAERGRRLAVELDRRLAAIEVRIAGRRRPRVLFVVWGEPLVVPGRDAFLSDALRRAGADSVTADVAGAWPGYDLEAAIGAAPEVILTVPAGATYLGRVRREPAWANVPAVRLSRLFVVGDAMQQPGPGVVAGIEATARLLHPAAFQAAGDGRSDGGGTPGG